MITKKLLNLVGHSQWFVYGMLVKGTYITHSQTHLSALPRMTYTLLSMGKLFGICGTLRIKFRPQLLFGPQRPGSSASETLVHVNLVKGGGEVCVHINIYMCVYPQQ